MDKTYKNRSMIVAAVILVLTTVFPIFDSHTYASYPKLEEIRVALFIKDRQTVPEVTLSSPGGLQIGVRHPSEIHYWVQHDSSQPIKFSMDQYTLKLLETKDYNNVIALVHRLDTLHVKPSIFQKKVDGDTKYKVYAGRFSSREEAESTKNELKKQSSIQNLDIQLSGPLHWNAGTYSSKEKAVDRLQELSDEGLNVNLALHENSQHQPVYSLWLGEAADQGQLDRIKAQAVEKVQGLKLHTIDPNLPYLLVKSEVSIEGDFSRHYFFNRQKIWVSSESGMIEVDERYHRTYRGDIEISQFDNELAVINELPFTQYLYSVVSSEMMKGWPIEALKAQAVAARTFALTQGMKYQIAHVSDTTYEQAYKGVDVEFPLARAAVQDTKGEVLVNDNGLITAFYYSNAGGLTADPSEVWGTDLDYIKSVPSPDEGAKEGKLLWDRVVLADGTIGFVRTDFTKETNIQNAAGFPYVIGAGTNVNVRKAPYVDNVSNPPVGEINVGDRMVLIEQTLESNAYHWVRGPFSAQHLTQTMNKNIDNPMRDSLQTLEVSKRGPSGRVIEMVANNNIIDVSSPDGYRSAMGSLPSTRFDVEEMGRYTILGAKGSKRNYPTSDQPLYVVGGEVDAQAHKMSSPMFVLNEESQVRIITEEPQFRFVGYGYGHGMGMSQWGAKELAEFLGYDYQEILKYYYHDVRIVKEGN